MAGIFISYRQGDTKAWAIGLRDDLAKSFGEDQVFLDKDALGPGNWREQLQRALKQCSVVLVVIGKQWLTIVDEQQRPRISSPNDVHRQEIAMALSHPGVTVIPILVDEATVPKADQLPEDIRCLTDQQAFKIGDTKARRQADLAVLVKGIEAMRGLVAREPIGDGKQSGSTEDHPPWHKLDYTAVGIAFVLTVVYEMTEYGRGEQFSRSESAVWLVVFYGLVVGGKWLWRFIRTR
jgi:hypothetical protein